MASDQRNELQPFVVLITGASRGIGLGLVKQLLNKDAPVRHLFPDDLKVVATCRSPDSAQDLQQLQREAGLSSLQILQLDVDCAESLSEARANFPHPYLNLLINNAGISTHNHPNDPILEAEAAEMERVYKTNCVSSLMVTQTFLPLTQSQPSPAQHPVVAFISSNFASIGTTFGGMVSYRCSKAALNMMVRTLAQEISFGETSPKQEQKLEDADGEEREIRGKSDVAKKPVFLLLSPGWAQTDMGGRGGRVAELSVEESTAAVLQVIRDKGSSLENSGGFYEYDGSILPW